MLINTLLRAKRRLNAPIRERAAAQTCRMEGVTPQIMTVKKGQSSGAVA